MSATKFVLRKGIFTRLGNFLSSSRGLWSILILAWVASLLFSNYQAWLCFTLVTLLTVLTGWFACRLLYGQEFSQRVESLGHILFCGLILITFFSIILAAFGFGFTPAVLVGASILGASLCWGLGFLFKQPIITVPSLTRTQTRLAISIGVLMVLGITLIPFMNVGRLVGPGYAYAPYFNRDFLRNLAFGAELANHPFPPQNPYISNTPLHYYWFQMVVPALTYQVAHLLNARATQLEDLLLLNTMLINISLVFILVHFVQRFARHTLTLVLVIALAFIAESYQAPFKAILSSLPTHWALEGTALGALALPPVGYFFQGLLYLPQHFGALAGVILVVDLFLHFRWQERIVRSITAGIILMLVSGFSFFLIAFAFLWVGTLLLWQALLDLSAFIKSPHASEHRKAFLVTIISGISLGVIGLLTYIFLKALAMLLDIGNAWFLFIPKFWLLLPAHFVVMLGPMFALGILGLVIILRNTQERNRLQSLIWLFVLSLGVVSFLRSQDLPDWEISQKLGFILRLATLPLVGIFLEWLLERKSKRQHTILAVLLLFCASAIPNLLAYEVVQINVWNSQLISYLSPAELHAAAWIRQNLPLDAVVQAGPEGQGSVFPYYRKDEDIYSLIPVFGERRTALGDPQFTRYYLPPTSMDEVDRYAAQVRSLFESPQITDVRSILQNLNITYIYWGVSEEKCCSAHRDWYNNSSMFKKVFDQEGVTIYQVVP